VARRPEVASREKNPAAAGIRRFFPLSNESKKKISNMRQRRVARRPSSKRQKRPSFIITV